jgi:hypothetical protein
MTPVAIPGYRMRHVVRSAEARERRYQRIEGFFAALVSPLRFKWVVNLWADERA